MFFVWAKEGFNNARMSGDELFEFCESEVGIEFNESGAASVDYFGGDCQEIKNEGLWSHGGPYLFAQVAQSVFKKFKQGHETSCHG